MALVAICYISQATEPFDKASLQRLVDDAARHNREHDITGCLVYDGGLFAQVLEGERDAVQPLLQRIARDPRHTDFRVVWSGQVGERQFDDWSMGGFDLDTSGAKADAALRQMRNALHEFVEEAHKGLREFPAFFRFLVSCREKPETEEITLEPPRFGAAG